MDDSGHHPGGQWQCVSDSEDCQKPSHGFYQKDYHGAELLQFPAVLLLLPSFRFLQIHQDGVFCLPQFAHFQCRFHMSEAAEVTSPPVLTES